MIAIYDSKVSSDFLLPAIYPGAVRLPAVPGERATMRVGTLPESISHFAFHLALTYTASFPVDRAVVCDSLRARGIVIVNERVTDISKRHIQDVLIQCGLPSTRADLCGPADELVIVKSNYNYGGEAEKRLAAADLASLSIAAASDFIKDSRDYRILRRSEVPEHLWTAPDVAIERFVQNAAHIFYRVYVCGSCVAVCRVYDPQPFKKMPRGIPRETSCLRRADSGHLEASGCSSDFPSVGLSNTLTRFLAAFDLDFGALDVVEDDCGIPYIIDVNTTPYWGNRGEYQELSAFLRSGFTI